MSSLLESTPHEPGLSWNQPGEDKEGSASAVKTEADLRQVIEGEIVPRLFLAHATSSKVGLGQRLPTEEDIEELARVSVRHDFHTVLGFVEALQSEGLSAVALRLELLAPAARLLGVWWEEDRCSFVQVGLGLSRLQQVVRRLSSDSVEPRIRQATSPILVTTAPNETHSFGAQIVADLLVREGWNAHFEIPASSDELERRVSTAEYSVLALSLSTDAAIEPTAKLMPRLRACSLNPRLKIAVGGSVFIDREGPFEGADVVVHDAPSLIRFILQSTGGRREPRPEG